MSAFIVSDRHINTIVAFTQTPQFQHRTSSYYHNGERHPFPDPTRLGQILLDENYRSVNFRYKEDTQPRTFHYQPSPTSPPLVHIFSLISGLDYQSCECEDWKDTVAYALLDHIKNIAITSLPGYRDAPSTLADPEPDTLSPMLSKNNHKSSEC